MGVRCWSYHILVYGGCNSYRHTVYQNSIEMRGGENNMTKLLRGLRSRSLTFYAMCVAAVTMLVAPAASLAVETPTEEKVKTVAEGVGTEGVAIVLAILGALVALLVAIIIIPKAVALIRRFV